MVTPNKRRATPHSPFWGATLRAGAIFPRYCVTFRARTASTLSLNVPCPEQKWPPALLRNEHRQALHRRINVPEQMTSEVIIDGVNNVGNKYVTHRFENGKHIREQTL